MKAPGVVYISIELQMRTTNHGSTILIESLSLTDVPGLADGILLTPRPWAAGGGRLSLLPLLPQQMAIPNPLPVEIYARILQFTLESSDAPEAELAWRKDLMKVSKTFKALVSPFIYAYAKLDSLRTLNALTTLLLQRDRQPIGLNRNPNPEPGRWLQMLDISKLKCLSQEDTLSVDSHLAAIFNLTPFLNAIALNDTIQLSRRTLMSLANSTCAHHLQSITDVQIPLDFIGSTQISHDPILALLSRTPDLEYLGLLGPGQLDSTSDALTSVVVPILHLPKLHHLSIRGVFASAAILALARSPLPSMRSLTVSRFDFLPLNRTFLPLLMDSVRLELQSLHFMAIPGTLPQAVADPVLLQFPSLTYLTLSSCSSLLTPTTRHPLRCLSIPKPAPGLLPEIEALLSVLPSLCVVRFWEVHWLPKSMNAFARASGVPGEMARWKRRLSSKRVIVLDADGKTLEDSDR